MEQSIIETQYPLVFRHDDAKLLGKHLRARHSVVLVGMKRVGISNFLRFFLYHKDITKIYLSDEKSYLFIPVDLNDLTEREIFPFWTLTLKRILDAVEKARGDGRVKQRVEMLFLDSIQSKDLFLIIENVRKALIELTEHDTIPTIFFLRFDRLKDAITPEFFANLQGLRDATHQKLSYVFTSVRPLDTLVPLVFTKASLAVFVHTMFVKPAKREDIATIYRNYQSRYRLSLSEPLKHALFDNVDGYVQYLQLAMILLHEEGVLPKNAAALFERLIRDERIELQSDELWESLTEQEQVILSHTSLGETITEEEKEKGAYLWDTGFIVEKSTRQTLFSPLFDYYVGKKQKQKPQQRSDVEFTKKEYLLFVTLRQHENEVCEREKIISYVWPEVEALGVSDWAIDRLVARVREKLKKKREPYQIQTVRTRGYKLVSS